MSGFEVELDLAHGARWNSLRDPAGREWLWSRPDVARCSVRPGDPFVDVGRVEECFPTLSGRPDHGEVWTLPWEGDRGGHWVDATPGRLSRSVRVSLAIVVDYRLVGMPFVRFLWSFHALPRPDLGTRITIGREGAVRSWIGGSAEPAETAWPMVGDQPADVLGPHDGTATFSVLPNVGCVQIEQVSSSLIFTLTAPGQLSAIGLWRNLGGYSWDGSSPYRSFGLEPMIGRGVDLAQTADSDCGVTPASGVVTWRLTIESRQGPK